MWTSRLADARKTQLSEIEFFGEQVSAIVVGPPVWDPKEELFLFGFLAFLPGTIEL